jgi:thymidylate synthase ThyX
MLQRFHRLRFLKEGKTLARPADDLKFQTLEMRNECINLPLSTYTEWYWQMDLKNMFHFLKLRMDSHAQRETQEYGRAMAL